ncbi:hypothetical protein CC80DRAFT_14310 [Byssothecium circinans]|uniref:Uncharacterized protein n=1 Tax=Byssothecium circinans TaxID=147558 RepID=A0A6A5U100_9PLEO|nr:hypothetical protein CC80DRAFT_14310 [Byssothecium circinans]
MADVAQAFDAAQKALGFTGKLRDQVAGIKAAVLEGRMTDVAKAMKDAGVNLTAAENQSGKAATAKQHAKTHARDIYLAWQVICEEYRRAIAETTLQTDATASKAVAAVASARNDKAAAEEDMLRALKVAAAALRDAKAGQHLRAADFFEALPAA